MREIKFRAFNKLNNQMWDYDHLVLNGIYLAPTGRGFVDVRNGRLNRLEELIPMQFTGLLTNDKKEIYELDRIRFTIKFWENRAGWSEDGFEGTVIFDKHGWRIKDVSFSKIHDSDYVFKMQGRSFEESLLEKYCTIRQVDFDRVCEMEIIGNLYSSPDLLKQKL